MRKDVEAFVFQPSQDLFEKDAIVEAAARERDRVESRAALAVALCELDRHHSDDACKAAMKASGHDPDGCSQNQVAEYGVPHAERLDIGETGTLQNGDRKRIGECFIFVAKR